eukprot:794236-Pyramimonas_sp.AAC.1
MHHFCGFFKQSSEDDPEDASFVPKYHGLIPVRNSNCTQTFFIGLPNLSYLPYLLRQLLCIAVLFDFGWHI